MDRAAGILELVSADVRVTIDVATGGRIAQIVIDGQPLLWAGSTAAIGWGAYPMAPWAGRLRHGRFEFDGQRYQLDLNHTDEDGSSHAIHGTVFDTGWEVDDCDDTTTRLHCDLRHRGWPFEGTARQAITVTGTGVRCELSVETDRGPFPAAVGWHPWFLKPDHLSFAPTAMYARDRIGLPAAVTTEPAPGPWDDTFLNTAPVVLQYPSRAIASTVTVISDCDHLVVYDQLPHATCVEPQSGPPDALSTRPELVTATDPLRRWMEISWTGPASTPTRR